MAKLTTLLLTVLITVQVWAQVPNTISYQAVIRNSNNELVANSSVGIQISILEGTTTGNEVYSETHSISTNANGLVSLQIGAGNTSDDFSSINWGTNSFFIKTEIDVDGGSNYSLTAISQLLSVPYALHAKTAESLIGGSLIVSSAIEDASSYNSEDGSISVSITGGTTPYTYYWTRIHESEDEDSGDFSNTNSSSISGITPGYYELYVSDANNTSSLKRFRVNHTGPVVTLNEVTPSCINSNTGSIDISVSGGTPPYTYKWTYYNEETWNEYNYYTEDIDNKVSGSYRIRVTDANGYKSEYESYYIPEYNPDITFSYTPSCSLTDGEIIAEVNSSEDGVSFSYEWSDSYELNNILSENATLSGIGAGNYYLKVTTSEGCESRVVSTTLEPSFNPDVNANKTYPCSGNTNGAIDITLDYTGDVSYEWSEDDSFSTIISTEEDLVDVSSGSYYLRLTNGDGCISSVKAFYLDENSIYLDISTETTNACSGNDGVFDITIANEGTYTYEWSNDYDFSDIVATTEDLTNLSNGYYSYYLCVTNEEGCKYTQSFWFEIENTFTPTITYTTTGVCSGNDGAIDITIEEEGTYTYEWSNSSDFSNIIATTEDLSNVSAGGYYYYLRVTNEEGCQYTQRFWFEIENTFTPTITYTTTGVCSGNDGAIDITIEEEGTYTYEWSNSSDFSNIIATTEDLSNLSESSYHYYLRVTNEDGCQYTQRFWFKIENTFTPTITYTTTGVCAGNDGAIDITIEEEGTYTYEWSNSSDFSNIIATTEDLSNLSESSYDYYLRVTNEDGCQYTQSFWFKIENTFTPTITYTTTGVCAGNDGAIDITIEEEGTYTYEWSNSSDFSNIIATTEDLSNVSAGGYYYYLRVTNEEGCQYTQRFWFEIENTFTPTITYTTTGVCSGNDGAIDITIEEEGTYTYEWSNSSDFSNIIATTEDLSNLSESSYDYYLRVTNEDGCQYTQSFWFKIENTFTPTITYTTTGVCAGNDGAIDITIEEEGTYTYEWSNSSDFSNIIATTEDLSNLSESSYDYYLRVTNEDGCKYTRNLWFEIGKSFSPAISRVVTDACSGESNGAIDLTVDYDGTVTYKWSRLSDFSAIISTEQDLSDIASGRYYYRLTNEKGCIYQSSVHVSSFWANIESSINNATSSSSADGAVNIYNQTDEECSYEWATDWEFTTIISTDEDLLNVGIGYYYLRVTNTNGCTDTYSYEIVSQ